MTNLKPVKIIDSHLVKITDLLQSLDNEVIGD